MDNIKTRTNSIQRDKGGSGKLVHQSNLLKQSYLLDTPVAVYGTLRRKFGNNSLLNDSLYIDEGKTEYKYPLLIRSSGLPFLINKPGVGHNVHVELYIVDNPTLSRLDMLEGHPDWYKRKKTNIIMKDGEKVNAWIYFGPLEYYNPQEEKHEKY